MSRGTWKMVPENDDPDSGHPACWRSRQDRLRNYITHFDDNTLRFVLRAAK